MFDVRSIITKLGGQSQIVRALDARGVRLSRQAVHRWINSGVIPGDRWADLVLLAEMQGWKIDIHRFLVRE